MVFAVKLVRDRLLRATGVLEAAGIPYAVVGDNAVTAWVSKVDPSAVRTSKDVGILLRRSNLNAAARAFGAAGFVQSHIRGHVIFLDGPDANDRDAVHIVFAGEKLRKDSLTAFPDVSESEKFDQFRVVSLEALVRMKLTSFRSKDNMHLRDRLDVRLIDATWPSRFPPEMAVRLQQLIDTLEG